MGKKNLCAVVVLALLAVAGKAQSPAGKLSVKWEELSATEFRTAIQQSKGTCLLPFGILEKHGPHLPLGTDLLNVRYASLHAAEQEYAIVFPEYYFGQIFEAKHEPGTIAYSPELQLKLLQETTDEMARNSCKKIVIVNGHGGNENLLAYFGQIQLERKRDYVVYIQSGKGAMSDAAEKKDKIDMHAGQTETETMMVSNPNLVRLDRAKAESGADQKGIHLPEDVYTGIWWYARFPNHYSGDGSVATREGGEVGMKSWIGAIGEAIRAVKADDASLKLQNEFYDKSWHPLDTQP